MKGVIIYQTYSSTVLKKKKINSTTMHKMCYAYNTQSIHQS